LAVKGLRDVTDSFLITRGVGVRLVKVFRVCGDELRPVHRVTLQGSL